ncbi:MAG: cytochrome C oxidase subunit IV family protein [Planctomycetes bacterium]|nr:cytochrome C oxidase subunit IV family protein [Planctomycetota bacterium]
MSAQISTRVYWNVFFALLACTALTVGQSQLFHALGHGTNIAIGLVIASFKASIVTLFFMHLRHEKSYFYGVALFPLVLVLVILFSNFPDVAFGDHTTPGEVLKAASH